MARDERKETGIDWRGETERDRREAMRNRIWLELRERRCRCRLEREDEKRMLSLEGKRMRRDN